MMDLESQINRGERRERRKAECGKCETRVYEKKRKGSHNNNKETDVPVVSPI